MADNKKYYYLKLKDNFYDSEQMIILQNMQDGYLYSDILMKLYLRSLKTEGKLMFNNLIPYTPSILAQVVRHQIGTVERALKIFQELGLIEVLENGAIYMLDIQNFIGKSSTDGDRKREYRTKINNEKLMIEHKKGQMSGQMSDKQPPEIEIEIEKDIEIEIDNICSNKNLNDTYQDEFNTLWDLYPNKKGKQKALSSYLRERKKTSYETILDGLNNYIYYLETEKVKPQFIKNGSTWFNQKCWEDDYTIKRKPTTKDLAKNIDWSDF